MILDLLYNFLIGGAVGLLFGLMVKFNRRKPKKEEKEEKNPIN